MTAFLRDVASDPFLWALGLLMLLVWVFGRRGREPDGGETREHRNRDADEAPGS